MIKPDVKRSSDYNLFRGGVVCIFLFILVLSSFSQVGESETGKQKSKDEKENQRQIEILKWNNLVEQITKDLLNDIKGNYSERPIILARLAKLWWKNDKDTARQWLKTAVGEVTFNRLNETGAEKEKRFEVAGKLIKFIMPMDQQLAEKLIEYVTKQANQSNSNKQNADELIKTALQVVESNPKLAKNLGSLSLKNGQSYLIVRLIRELNLKDEKLGEALFAEGLLNAETFPNLETSVGFVSSLSTAAFREYKGKSLSEAARKNFLTVLFNLLSIENALTDSQKQSCNFISTAAGLISSYEIYFPEKIVAIKQKAKLCEKILGGFADLVNSDLGEIKPQTAEEFIEAAKETKNDSLKAIYYQKAIEKLYYAKEYEQVISVLEDMNEVDRNAFGKDSWDSWRWESALKASAKYVKEKNFSGAYRIINNTPAALRPTVQSGLANEMAQEDKPFAISLLGDARKGLNSFDIEPNTRAGLLLYLVKQFIEIAPYEAISVFREAIKAVNISDKANPENNPVKDFAPLKETILLPIFLLESEDFATMKILSEIDSTDSRIRFRLGFLEQSLEKFEQVKTQREKLLETKLK